MAGKTNDIAQEQMDFGGKKFLVIVSVLITTVVLDLSFLRIYDIVSKATLSLQTREFIFTTITVACFASQYLLLRTLRPQRKETENRREATTRVLYLATMVVLVGLGALMGLIISEVLVLTYYDKLVLEGILISSYVLSAVIIGLLVTQIISWISLRKTMVIVILFVIGLSCITFNSIIAMVDAWLRLSDRPDQIRPFFAGSSDISKGKYDAIDRLYFYSFIISYLTAWLATAALLFDYSSKLGLTRYSLLVAAPLVFFVFQFGESFLMLLSPVITIDKFFVTNLNQAILSFSKPIGGIMLGIQFWMMARFAKKDPALRSFLIIAGFGMLLVFSSNQILLFSITPYPPFGLSAITVLGLSSYMVLVGLYRSSVAITGNRALRQEIRLLATSETRLVEGIITGEKRKEIEAKVSRLVKDRSIEIETETGSSPAMTEDEVKQHLEVVLREIKRIQ